MQVLLALVALHPDHREGHGAAEVELLVHFVARTLKGFELATIGMRVCMFHSEEALRKEGGAVAAFARAEGLDAHGRSGTIRFE